MTAEPDLQKPKFPSSLFIEQFLGHNLHSSSSLSIMTSLYSLYKNKILTNYTINQDLEQIKIWNTLY
ncbi:hypothetical protein bsdE14_14180 [Clostridium omnivorum]|uniref:Uncharacterized protein n=1 Tax=Clostridium omnivorum TaxID=1604902 RepID=A0ABQ5N464_9CLOT|nr:hypothetical protein bsdE14_14180 [Clostridium sp. E14]